MGAQLELGERICEGIYDGIWRASGRRGGTCGQRKVEVPIPGGVAAVVDGFRPLERLGSLAGSAAMLRGRATARRDSTSAMSSCCSPNPADRLKRAPLLLGGLLAITLILRLSR